MTKWIKLRKICEGMCGKTVHLHASTDMPEDHIAGCEFTQDTVHIILNMEQTKSNDMIIRAISHEMTHVLEGSNDHRIDFDTKWAKIEYDIKREYENN